jgi:hypothetical protein
LIVPTGTPWYGIWWCSHHAVRCGHETAVSVGRIDASVAADLLEVHRIDVD